MHSCEDSNDHSLSGQIVAYTYDVFTCVYYNSRTIHTEGSAHDSALATAPDWRDGIGALLHLCRRTAIWPDNRWVGHGEADAGLRVQ